MDDDDILMEWMLLDCPLLWIPSAVVVVVVVVVRGMELWKQQEKESAVTEEE